MDLQQFFEHADVADALGCWRWLRSKSSKGYGNVYYNNKWHSAHRTSYELCVGPIPDDLQIDHLCFNTSCVNPTHLEPVSNLENRQRRNEAQLLCKNGHPLFGNNLSAGLLKRGKRECKICKRGWSKKYRASLVKKG